MSTTTDATTDTTTDATTDATTTTVTDTYVYHVPATYGIRDGQLDGCSVRDAVHRIRHEGRRALGDIGTVCLYLSDSTTIEVELTPTCDGSARLMASQRMARRDSEGRLIRYYAW